VGRDDRGCYNTNLMAQSERPFLVEPGDEDRIYQRMAHAAGSVALKHPLPEQVGVFVTDEDSGYRFFAPFTVEQLSLQDRITSAKVELIAGILEFPPATPLVHLIDNLKSNLTLVADEPSYHELNQNPGVNPWVSDDHFSLIGKGSTFIDVWRAYEVDVRRVEDVAGDINRYRFHDDE